MASSSRNNFEEMISDEAFDEAFDQAYDQAYDQAFDNLLIAHGNPQPKPKKKEPTSTEIGKKGTSVCGTTTSLKMQSILIIYSDVVLE